MTSSVIKQQLGELFKALGLDPSAPDAYRKGLQTLAAVHHGVGYFTSDKPIPPNRNAAKWTTQDDDLLHEFVKEDEEGIDQALRRISKIPKNGAPSPPLSSSSRSQTPANQLRYEALRKRWTRISKIAPPGSWLAAIAGDYPILRFYKKTRPTGGRSFQSSLLCPLWENQTSLPNSKFDFPKLRCWSAHSRPSGRSEVRRWRTKTPNLLIPLLSSLSFPDWAARFSTNRSSRDTCQFARLAGGR